MIVPIYLFVCLLRLWLSDINLSGRRIIPAVLNSLAILVDEFQLDGVLAAGPAGKPDWIPYVDESGRGSINRVADSIIAGLPLQTCIHKPEVNHDRIGIFAGIITFWTAVGEQGLGDINGTRIAFGDVFPFASGCGACTCDRALRGASHHLPLFCRRW